MPLSRNLPLRTLAAALACTLAGASPALAQEAKVDETAETASPRPLPLPGADFDETLRIGGDEIEARKLRSRMTVEVMVNDTGPHKFVVDSGADTSVIGADLAEELGLARAKPAMLHSMTDVTQVDRVEVDSLELGPSRFAGLTLPVLREFHLGGDGMIGLDALVEQRLMLDFDKRVITVEDSASRPSIYGRDAIVVVGRLQRGQLILTDVEAQGQKVEAVIDTGTEVTIGNSLLRAELLRRFGSQPEQLKIFGVTGAVAEIEFAEIAQLRLGPITFKNVMIAFADVPPFDFFGINDKPALLLGTDLMETFRRVSLDFRKRKVRFELSRCTRQTVKLRTTRTASLISADRRTACER